jgi:DNA-binding HxlR family transcriptional regulator
MMVAKKPALPSQALPVLDALEKVGPLGFTELQRRLRIRPSTLDRALKALVDEVLVQATMVPESRRRGSYDYEVTRRGRALLRSARAYHRALQSEAHLLGPLAHRLDPLTA